jgi:hypothetical protein
MRSVNGLFFGVFLLSLWVLPPRMAISQSIPYDKAGQDLLFERFQKRKPLSPSDEKAKEAMLTLLPAGKTSGILYESPNVIIGYVGSPADDLNVEILTADISAAKQEAIDWFVKQGLSLNALCDLPVSFYLNSDVAGSIREKNFAFNPIAEHCLPDKKKKRSK